MYCYTARRNAATKYCIVYIHMYVCKCLTSCFLLSKHYLLI